MSVSASMKAGLKSVKDFYNLAIGSPDISPPNELIELIYSKHSQLNFNYMPSMASEVARANVLKIVNGQDKNNDVTSITLIPGAKYGIYNSLKTITNPGEKVLIIEPYWLSYPEIVNSLNLDLEIYQMDLKFSSLDILDLQNKIKEIKPQVLIINNPNNPLGSVLENSELKKLIDFCADLNVWVLLDEVYKDLTFSQHKLHASLNSYNLIRIGSFSKSLSIPGLRLGYVLGSPEFIERFNIFDQHITTSINSLSHLVAENLNCIDYPTHIKNIVNEYKNRYIHFSERIKEIDCEIINIESSFYCLVKSPKYSNGADYKEYLYSKMVLVTEGAAYGKSLDEYVRVCLTLPMEQLIDASSKFH